MKVIEHEQAIASEIVGKLEREGYRPVVAGGAPRSWYLGESCNDIDVFLFTSPERIKNIEDILQTKFEEKGEDYQVKAGLLRAVYEGEINGKIVQLMFLVVPPMHYILNNFPFTLCKFWFENGEVKSTWDARLSLEEQVFIDMYQQWHPDYLDKLSRQLNIRPTVRPSWKEFFRRPPLNRIGLAALWDANHQINFNPAAEIEMPNQEIRGHRGNIADLAWVDDLEVPDPDADERIGDARQGFVDF